MSEVWSEQTEREEAADPPAFIPFYESFDSFLDNFVDSIYLRMDQSIKQTDTTLIKHTDSY